LLPLMALAGCVTTPEQRSFSVQEVDEKLVEWNGRTVFVSGYVYGCDGWYPCGLSEGPRAAVEDAALAIEFDPNFAEMLGKARGYKVLIEAELDAGCRINICVGWPSELKPKRLIRAY
ncbi:MAG: hypothetical protein AAF650_07985, partial [Pseudomonadota bacterium]